ncbi:MAG: serine/threonine-protein phosphatase, partial [Treponema sp.]|nr:serine/threonine-protein phosphatase [Treponema sp.]
ILNEGRNIVGLITMGKKISGDHLKEYDYNVFTKYYSYFFVFGYYMRNISNKEVISTVNREIKMSSQIITSIQENIDHVKNEKSDIGYLMVPAHNIGGEFIDMIRLTDTRHLFVIGDLSGKGIAASMNMVILKSIIRTYLAETHDFKTLVVKINSFIRDSLRKGTIFAGLFALMDYETDTIYYINCGIPAMFLYTEAYNNVIEIQGSGHILGFVSDISPYISVKQIKLNKSDIVFTCTRGLIESHSLRGEQYGKDRIQRNMVANVMYPAHRMAQFSYDNLMKFMSHELEDDISVLVMKYLKNEVEETEEEESSAQPGKITDSLQDDGPSADDIFANVEVIG